MVEKDFSPTFRCNPVSKIINRNSLIDNCTFAVKSLIIFFSIILSGDLLYAQFSISPEVWSRPKRLLPSYMPMLNYEAYSLTTTGDTLIYANQKVYFIYKDSQGGWHGPEILSHRFSMPYFSPIKPTLSPDKKTLYFTDTRNGFMYKSTYDDSSNNWNQPKLFYDNGFNLNPTWYCMNLSNDSTMFVLAEERSRLAKFKDSLWFPNYEYPKPSFGASWTRGLWLDPTGTRAYIGYEGGTNGDLYVWNIPDSVRLINGRYRLNISSMSDSFYNNFTYIFRNEKYPFLSQDRRKLVFLANYYGQFEYWISHLLIDENGNPVPTSVEEENPVITPEQNEIHSIYPNPFNSSTLLEYRLKNEGEVNIIIYDVTGRTVKVIEKGRHEPGNYEVPISLSTQASGVYFIRMEVVNTESGSIYSTKSKKLIMLK